MGILNYYHAIRYQKPSQIVSRIALLFRRYCRLLAFPRLKVRTRFPTASFPLKFMGFIPRSESFVDGTFCFLNLSKTFPPGEIDWEYSGHGRLWNYHLRYFDYLNQTSVDLGVAVDILEQFISRFPGKRLEPQPTSIRIVNWIKWIHRCAVRKQGIDNALYKQCQFLYRNMEFHLKGNHLLDNAFALLFGSYYFRNRNWYGTAKKILEQELETQVLKDGGHYELSPMYHGIVLDRLLDCINLVRNNTWKNHELMEFFSSKAGLMLKWLRTISFGDGEIPLLNDSAGNVIPPVVDLQGYANRLGVLAQSGYTGYRLSESGYRKIKRNDYEALVDVGNIKSDCIPGHSHNDIFHFVLWRGQQPILVDTGVSTYEDVQRRNVERGTGSHNTVQVGHEEQNEIWERFRVGRRARIIDLSEEGGSISASHTGYKKRGFVHRRKFQFKDHQITISDFVKGRRDARCKCYLHFSPDVNPEIEKNHVVLDGLSIEFYNHLYLKMETFWYAPQFHITRKAGLLIVDFMSNTEMTTRMEIH